MFAYIRINQEILIDERFDSRKLIDILGILLAVMLLCILAGRQTTSLQVMEALAEDQDVSENTAGILPEEISWIPGNNAVLDIQELSGILAENRISPLPLLPELPQPASLPAEEWKNLTVEDAAAISSEPAAAAKDPAAVPEEPSTAPSGPSVIPDTVQTPSAEEPDSGEFPCNGFLCNASGIIISCQNAPVIDGVLCLPSDAACTGIASGALNTVEAQIFEIYIPSNIVTIEDGSFDTLTELCFIEVHPDNPVYRSSEGILCRK